MSGPAFATIDAGRNDRKLEGTVFEPLKRSEAPLVVGFMAVGEMIVDKLPFLPNRTDPLPLIGRLVLGGTAGAAVFAGEGESALVGAAIGSLGALVSSFVGFRVRMFLIEKVGLPNLVGGLVGDAAVIGIGSALLRAE
jgi:uncharacterized membrane protein